MSLPIAIIDKRSPQKAIETLSKIFEVHLFMSQNITTDPISGHPDVFMCKTIDSLIIAPNTPLETITFLQKHSISYVFGETFIDETLKNSSAYNCICLPHGIIHRNGYTDNQILQQSKLSVIATPQSFIRCTLCMLTDRIGVTSDSGVQATLKSLGYDVFLCNPSNILLPPYLYGFIGGCLGIYNGVVYCIGNLDNLENGTLLREFIVKNGFEICELYDGPLYDGGGIFIF